MKYKYNFIFAFLLLISTSLSAQNDRFAVGAAEAGTGFAAQTRANAFSVFNNTAGLAKINGLNIGAYAENRFLVADINLFGLGVALPTKSGTFGLGLHRYGNGSYSETKVRLGYGRLLAEKLSIGATFELGSLAIEEYGSNFNFTFDLGFQYNILDNVRIGATIYNPLRMQLTDNDLDRLPTILTFGSTYQPSEKVAIHIEVQKNLDFKASFRGGVDYRLLDVLSIQAGFVSNPNMATAGFGIHLKGVKINIAGSWHPYLAYTPHIGVHYAKGGDVSFMQESEGGH